MEGVRLIGGLLMEVQQCIVILKCVLGWARESKRLYSKGNAMTIEDMTVHVKGLNPTSSALNLPLSLSSCCTGESTCLPPMWPGFKSQCRRHMWFEFVVSSLPCSKRFFSGTPVFPSPQNPIFPDSNSIRNQVNEELPCGCATSKSLYIFNILFIYYFIV